jgi:hypothetical protein
MADRVSLFAEVRPSVETCRRLVNDFRGTEKDADGMLHSYLLGLSSIGVQL